MSRSRVDVVVVGAGPAGLAAATAAAERGRRVLLLDQAPRVGGQIWRHRAGDVLPPRAANLLQRFRRSGAVHAAGASVIDAEGGGRLVVDFSGRVDTIGCSAVVLATGAVERLLPFPGWTLPGVTGVGGLQALVKGGLSVRGARVVLAGTGPLLYPVAASLVAGGATLCAVLEQASRASVLGFGLTALRSPGRLVDAARYRSATWRIPWHHDAWVIRAEGDGRVERAVLHVRGREVVVSCEWVATAAGLAPRTELARLLGCALEDDAIAVDACQATSVPDVWAAGECTGVKGDASAIIEGEIAGAAAAGDGGLVARTHATVRAKGVAFGRRLAVAFAVRPEVSARAAGAVILCRCEDVPAGAIDASWSPRQAKLWTRLGMGACQGAVCGQACSALHAWPLPLVRAPLGSPPLAEWARVVTASDESPAA